MEKEIVVDNKTTIAGSPYKQVKTDKEIILKNGVVINPVATLKDKSGGVAQWGIDDHCYVLYLKKDDGTYNHTAHIFKEAFNVLKTLPDLN